MANNLPESLACMCERTRPSMGTWAASPTLQDSLDVRSCRKRRFKLEEMELPYFANIKVETYSIAQLLPVVIVRSRLQPQVILRLIARVSGIEGRLEIRLQFQNTTNLVNLAT